MMSSTSESSGDALPATATGLPGAWPASALILIGKISGDGGCVRLSPVSGEGTAMRARADPFSARGVRGPLEVNCV